MMNQNKMYKYATWTLLLLNIAVLAFFIITKPKPPHHLHSKDFKSEVGKILDLSDEQVVSFEAMAKAHNQKMKSINEKQQKLLLPYFKNIADTSKNIDEEEALIQFQKLEREKMEVTHHHLEEVKSLLNETQLPQFKEFVDMFVDRVLRVGKKTPPHRK